ncbi:hypothetical protein EDC19_1122 [Natranaerovirga hydrolytica]|uniref:Sporulation membrane protein YtrI C-terminal domain-containing protein n=1 Tax=Natranaerovirga hydrolytica TaxID=680378 RepID=A0A4R1N6N3_9FIRM|nr:hypothetical protein [Natranaerovirga hydrolytica]TCK98689.1 hypothetical protein EDC19_1122 [Natranaerovirga hydrolytica]
MAQLIKQKHKYFIFFLTGLILGLLIGVSGLTAIISYRIDLYYQRIITLETEIDDKTTRLAKLEERLDEAEEEPKYILKDIHIHLNSEEDDIDTMTLTKHIKEKYTNFIGRDILSIDLEIISEIIDQRIFRLDNKSYQLETDKVFMSDILTIWVNVSLLNDNE